MHRRAPCVHTERTFFNVYLDGSLLISTARIGAIIGFANLFTIPASLATPPLVHKLGKVKTVVAGALGAAASIVVLGFSGQWVLAAGAFICTRSLAAFDQHSQMIAQIGLTVCID